LTPAEVWQIFGSMPELNGASFNGDFRTFLEKEFTRRKKNNPAYSLRAFSNFLGVNNAQLSKYLRRERPASLKFIERAGERLKLSPKDIAVFHAAAEARLTVPSYLDTEREFSRYTQLSEDAFASIEDWRHYAILELMKVNGFQSNSKWIANALGISTARANEYIRRLQTVGLLQVLPDGTWKDVSEGCSTDYSNEFEVTKAHQRAQKVLLKRAIQAVDQIECTERDQGSAMMATDAARIAGAKKMITKFMFDLCRFLEKSNRKDSIYQLSISLFPLVKTHATKKGAKT
jgi:uncharacterized protein (TIGR02147 family)